MDWTKLLNASRRKGRSQIVVRELGAQPVDHDCADCPTPFRWLTDRMLVFPLGLNDRVQTRRTHSHEVGNNISHHPPYSRCLHNPSFENWSRIAEDSDNRMPVRYRELQVAMDMIADMSDSTAITLRRELERLHG